MLTYNFTKVRLLRLYSLKWLNSYEVTSALTKLNNAIN
jgi:hypothetical protein